MGNKLGKDNPQYAEILKNVAVLYISEKKYDIAFSSLTQAETIWRTKTGTKSNINAASIYTLTGDVYYQLKNYKKAEEFYNKGKDLYNRFFSSNHPEYVKVLSKLAKVYYMEKEFKRAKKNIEEALGNYENFIKQYFPALSEMILSFTTHSPLANWKISATSPEKCSIINFSPRRCFSVHRSKSVNAFSTATMKPWRKATTCGCRKKNF